MRICKAVYNVIIPEFRMIFNNRTVYISVEVVPISMLGVKICTDEKMTREEWENDVV